MAQPIALRALCCHGSTQALRPLRVSSQPAYKRFSTTSRRGVKTTEMSREQLAAVRINPGRLWRDLHETCEWGKGERWGE